MEERTIIKSEIEKLNKKQLALIPIILGATGFIVPNIYWIANDMLWVDFTDEETILLAICIPSVLVLTLLNYFLCWLFFYRTELTVTDSRVYGRTLFGSRVDIPADSISAVATTKLFKGVAVASSSGRISFFMLKNRDELYKEIGNLIIERQKNASHNSPNVNFPVSSVDELKKYKELLDSGVITQQDFDAKKKQILGL